ncbi:hypothetical protein [Plasticicumulans sp.]|uniref:hypothetical protein n=1 Tax=Plasticicumulans sp. TaxID=2307179 RepID=UPI00394F2B1C
MSLIDAALKLRALREQEAARAAARAAALDNAMRLGLADAGVSDPADQALLAAPNVRALSPAEQAQLPGVASGQFAPDANSYRQQAIAQMARDQLGQSFNLADAGLDEHKLAQARDEQARTRTFLQVAQDLAAAKAAGRPISGWDVLSGNFANRQRLEAPVDVKGDTTFRPYDTAAPVIGATPLGQARIGAEQALGTYRTAAAGDETEQTRLHAAQARLQEMRAQAAEDLLNNPNAPYLLKLRALEGNTPYPTNTKPEKVWAVDKSGKAGFAKAIPIINADGSFTLQPMRNPDGSVVEWTKEDDKQTAHMRDTEYDAARMGMTADEYKEWQARNKLTKQAVDANFGNASDPQKIADLISALMDAARRSAAGAVQNRPGNPPRPAPAAPAQAAGGQPAAGRAAVPPEAATLIAQANAAIARGKDKNAVQTRLRAMLRELGVDPTAVGY